MGYSGRKVRDHRVIECFTAALRRIPVGRHVLPIVGVVGLVPVLGSVLGNCSCPELSDGTDLAIGVFHQANEGRSRTRHGLADAQWEVIADFFPATAETGRPPTDRRMVVSARFC